MPVDQQGPTRSSPLLVTAALVTSCALLLDLSGPTHAESADVAALEQRIAELNKELEQAKRELAAAKRQTSAAEEKAARAEAELATRGEPESDKFQIGPVTIGGAMRVNYILGSHPNGGSGPSRGGNGGNFELDTYRINMALSYERLAGKLEYRWYNGYNFIHTGWLGYDLAEGSQIQVGVTRVPFGPGPYGVSQSWFFDQHYYVGLADDPDLGIKYVTEIGDWNLDLAYFVSSEWNGNGTSADSARYGYDAVSWRSAIDENGDVVSAPVNGYQERNQVNLRAIYSFSEAAIPTDLGVSLQYGQLEGRRADDLAITHISADRLRLPGLDTGRRSW